MTAKRQANGRFATDPAAKPKEKPPRKPPGRKTAVPATVEMPSAESVELWARTGMSLRQIAQRLGVCEDTVRQHFSANIYKIRAGVSGLLGGMMFQKAHAGHWPAMKFLSQQKRFLGFSTAIALEGEEQAARQFDPDYLERMRQNAGRPIHEMNQERLAEAARKDAEWIREESRRAGTGPQSDEGAIEAAKQGWLPGDLSR